MKVLCSFLLLSICIAQAPTPKPWKAQVTAILSKSSFQPSEPIKVRLQLENTGLTSFYISRNFGGAGGGIAGFYSRIEDEKGKSAETCLRAGDVWPADDRPAQQILKESYILLAPGEFVGVSGEISSCPPTKPGTYTITAYYSPQDFRQKRVENIPNRDFLVLDAVVHAPTVTFKILPIKKKRGRSRAHKPGTRN